MPQVTPDQVANLAKFSIIGGHVIMATKENEMLKVERVFGGNASLEEILMEFIGFHLDTLDGNLYDDMRASAIPSVSGGVAKC